jgi:hypothetical protein
MVTERTDCGDVLDHPLSPFRHRYNNYFGSVTNVMVQVVVVDCMRCNKWGQFGLATRIFTG